jgi:penicillin-binding protein 1A
MDVSPLGMGGLTYGLNTVEMAAAYAAFANNGIYTTPRTYLRVEDAEGNVILENESESRVAMKETTAYLMNKLLKNAVAAGTGTSARFNGMAIAGKTGTTSQNYDRYFVGYTPYYVAAVWTGYDENEKISYDGNPAITMWKKVMQQVHAELPNKDFTRPASGLQTVTICADSGKLCTDACHADPRGSRAISVEIPAEIEFAETDVCMLHTFRDYCTAGACLATTACTVDCVIQAGLLNIPRVDYGPEIVAEDAAYVIADLERTMGLVPRLAEDGVTPIYPEVIGCPVHTGGGWYDPELDWPWNDPSDPNYIPPWPGIGEEDLPSVEDLPPLEEPPAEVPPVETPPVEVPPTVPQEPTEPPAAGEEDWWSDFWEEENQG